MGNVGPLHYLAAVTSPDERADSGARNAAIKLVEDAFRAGRIVQADHDMRIDQLRRAQTMQEVDLQVRDLRPVAAAAGAPATPVPSVTVSSGQQPWPLVNYGPGSSAPAADLTAAAAKTGRTIGGVVALVVLISVIVPIAGAVIAFVSARDSFPDFGDIGPTDETTYLPGQPPGEDGVNVLTVEGVEALVDAVREEVGATFVFNATLYPRYAVVDVPTGVNDRYEAYYWDGRTLEKNTSRGSSTDNQIDLSLVDPAQVVRMVQTVHDRLDSPDSWYVSISAFGDGDAQVMAAASNDFGENTSLIESLDGTVVYDSETAS